MGWWWPAAGLGALSVAVHARDLLKEVTIILARAAAMVHIATPRPRSGAEAGKNPCLRGGQEELPMSEVRGSSRECQGATAQEQPRGATPRPRSGAAATRSYPASEDRVAAGRSYPMPEARGGGRKD